METETTFKPVELTNREACSLAHMIATGLAIDDHVQVGLEGKGCVEVDDDGSASCTRMGMASLLEGFPGLLNEYRCKRQKTKRKRVNDLIIESLKEEQKEKVAFCWAVWSREDILMADARGSEVGKSLCSTFEEVNYDIRDRLSEGVKLKDIHVERRIVKDVRSENPEDFL